MNKFLLFCFVGLFCHSAYGQVEEVKTREEWTALIRNDAKLEALIAKIGKPDEIAESGMITECHWKNRVGDNKTGNSDLIVKAMKCQGADIICSIFDATSGRAESFPWAKTVAGQAVATLGPSLDKQSREITAKVIQVVERGILCSIYVQTPVVKEEERLEQGSTALGPGLVTRRIIRHTEMQRNR